MLELLKIARAKITDPEHWCQAHPARTASGAACDYKSETASKWCMAGAVWSSSDDNVLTRDTFRFLTSVAPELPELVSFKQERDEKKLPISIFDINDTLGHEITLKVFDYAISKLEPKENGEKS